MKPPQHHKEVALFLRDKFEGNVKVTDYMDNNNINPVPIGEFGSRKKCFSSTIGAFDMKLKLPEGNYELASYGDLKWLPNALASSIYWLKERKIEVWPLVCEDVVKHNAKSTYRHMAYIPSDFSTTVSTGQKVQWLLGIPITDKEINISSEKMALITRSVYPEWLFNENA